MQGTAGCLGGYQPVVCYNLLILQVQTRAEVLC
jgi:hypothetical protein